MQVTFATKNNTENFSKWHEMIFKVFGFIEIFKVDLNAFFIVFLCKRQQVSQWFILNVKNVVLLPKK